MKLSLFKTSTGNKEAIDIEEVFNIWSLLRTRHEQVQTIDLLRNFIHVAVQYGQPQPMTD